MLVSTAGAGVPVVVLVFSRRIGRPVAAGFAGVGALPLRSRTMVASCDEWCKDDIVASGVERLSRLGGLSFCRVSA
jgi:hypothetical protein